MKFGRMLLPLLAAALALPAAARAQEEEPCPDRPCPGVIGISFEDDDDGEIRIIDVRRGSGAERAGLREGDVIVRVDGERATLERFTRLELEAGDAVRLRVRRDGDERDVTVVATRRRPATAFRVEGPRGLPGGRSVVIINDDTVDLPLEELAVRIDSLHTRLLEIDPTEITVRFDTLIRVFGDSLPMFLERMPEIDLPGLEGDLRVLEDDLRVLSDRPFFMELGRRSAAGAELAEMNEGLGRYFPNATRGALVIDVSEDSPASRAGLQPGDVIVEAGGDEVTSPEDVREALMRDEDGEVSLEVVRQGRRRELTLEWENPRGLLPRERVRGVRPGRVREN